MRVLVTGSRDWDDGTAIYRALHVEVVEKFWLRGYDSEGNFVDWIKPDDFVLVHGDCPTGADMISDEWCISRFFVAERHPADWKKFGKPAGFIRNKEMVERGADLCLAFIKNNSRGASMTADLAEKAGIKTLRYER